MTTTFISYEEASQVHSYFCNKFCSRSWWKCSSCTVGRDSRYYVVTVLVSDAVEASKELDKEFVLIRQAFKL
jgi:hypothetical protein